MIIYANALYIQTVCKTYLAEQCSMQQNSISSSTWEFSDLRDGEEADDVVAGCCTKFMAISQNFSTTCYDEQRQIQPFNGINVDSALIVSAL